MTNLNDSSMKLALDKVATKEFTLRKAAMVYNIPIATLSNAKNNKYSSNKRGSKFALSESTQHKITTLITAMADMGFGLTRENIFKIIENYLIETGQQNLFKHGKPSSYIILQIYLNANFFNNKLLRAVLFAVGEKVALFAGEVRL